MITWRGKKFNVRGANKRYRELDDLDALFEKLKLNCPAHVAKELGVPPTCVLYLIDKYFNEVEKSQIKWARNRHFNSNNSKIRTKRTGE